MAAQPGSQSPEQPASLWKLPATVTVAGAASARAIGRPGPASAAATTTATSTIPVTVRRVVGRPSLTTVTLPSSGMPRLDDLTRAELATLARELMLAVQVNDRTGLAAVRLHGGDLDFAATAIEEWMGASPVYTRRMQRALGFDGDDVPTIFKGLQLDAGFAHQYMDVRYEVDDAASGRFWLPACGALTDIEPLGEQMVHTMCHTIEDPTFDATAVATNRRARIRPEHRPPRPEPHDDTVPVCAWTVTIDPALDPVPDHPLTAVVAASALANVALGRPPADPGDDGMRAYDGPVMPEPHLERFSRDALVVVAKEVAVQGHLLVRSLALAVAEAAGADVATGILESQMIGTGWIVSERLARHLGLPPGAAGLDGIATVLSLHPAFLPAEYQPISVEPTDAGRALVLRLLGGPAADDDDHASWAALLRAGTTSGLEAIAQGVDRRARVESVAGEAGAWRITVDLDREPAATPDWARIGQISGSADFVFAQRVELR